MSEDDERTSGLVDADKLGAWMDEQGLPGKGEPVEATFISGGASNEIFQIRRAEYTCVLRRPPAKVPEGRNETMLREYRVLAALNGTDVPHPEAIAVCEDTSVLGAAFYLMNHIDGWSPMNTDGWPEPFLTDLEARRGLAFELDGIAKLAKVDWQARGLEGFGKPDGYVDYTGMPSRTEILDYYTNESGRPVDDIDYYVILARSKIAIVLEGGYARLVRGEADNPKMQAFGEVVLSMARNAAELASTTSL